MNVFKKKMLKMKKWNMLSSPSDLQKINVKIHWGIHIYSEFMIVKNDRQTNAYDYYRNTDYSKHLRNIVRATLLEPAAPIGIRLIIDLFEAYLQSSGLSILMIDQWLSDKTWTYFILRIIN